VSGTYDQVPKQLRPGHIGPCHARITPWTLVRPGECHRPQRGEARDRRRGAAHVHRSALWRGATTRPNMLFSCRVALQLRTHPDVDRERLRRRDRTVVEQHVRQRVRDRRLRIEEGAEGREFAIEQVVYDPVDLPLLGELVRAVQVCDPVVGELGVLVGVVANEPLAADPDDVGAEFQLRRDPVVDAPFDLVLRYARDLLAWRDEDISICVRERIVR